MLPAIKFAVIGFAIVFVLLVIFKIAYINLTPGEYVKYGCCSYGYLTEEQIQKEKMKINICPRVECKIEQTPTYKLHTLFNKLDFNK